MSEPTLSLTYDELRGEVGFFLGLGRGSAQGGSAWSNDDERTINFVVKSGLRRFYYPSDPEVAPSGYDWSFLKPVASLSLASGASTLRLPDDFGGLEGQVTVSSSTGGYAPIPVVGEGMIRQRFAESPSATGRPLMAALRPLKGTTGAQGQRFELFVWPTADATYTLQLAYYVAADYLNTAFPYHLGGSVHAETILESCLAIAEQRLDDAMTVHTMAFKERLLASINHDRKNKPQSLGYNADCSDLRGRTRGNWREEWGTNSVTVGGVEY